jgi:hypothetical protein
MDRDLPRWEVFIFVRFVFIKRLETEGRQPVKPMPKSPEGAVG